MSNDNNPYNWPETWEQSMDQSMQDVEPVRSTHPRTIEEIVANQDEYAQRFMDFEPTALAYTPDEEIERGVEAFKQLWPDKWEAWLRWCRRQEDR